MDRVIFFIALSLPVIFFSKQSLFEPHSHGFTRFFSWECIIILFVFNYTAWFKEPFSARQIVSWLLLIISLWFLIESVVRIRRARKPGVVRVDEKLFRFEQTTEIVTSGIYRYIRHPMYSSLLFLTWGIWFKQPLWYLLPVAFLASWLLYLTARRDEKECQAYFGEKYTEYMKETKRLIPFIM
ncbi:MAG: isoprenylcysteine carboxylmethyltransferase family protein, partial [Bacteroidales bacterium]|jgi:protein-S-isoprenylcysteine O-methyltransferase Ste14|nr:isoprenylcysteine carboxylmethyltransferase family protein [Bacteroidales bacterium]